MPSWRFGLLPWLNKKIVDPLLQIIPRGVEPKKLAFSTAMGTTLGLFPICGLTVILCGMVIALLRSRCHAPSIMLANFVATPVELRPRISFWSSLIRVHIFARIQFSSRHRMPHSRALGMVCSLVIPFLRLGELITGGPHFPLTSNVLKKVVMGQASREVLVGVLHALLGWFVAAPFILVALYVILLPCFKYLILRFSDKPLSPDATLYSHPQIQIKIRDA